MTGKKRFFNSKGIDSQSFDTTRVNLRESSGTFWRSKKIILEIKLTNFKNQKFITEIKRTKFGNQKVISEIKPTGQESKHVIILMILFEYSR